jgi:hypothetical protein
MVKVYGVAAGPMYVTITHFGSSQERLALNSCHSRPSEFDIVLRQHECGRVLGGSFGDRRRAGWKRPHSGSQGLARKAWIETPDFQKIPVEQNCYSGLQDPKIPHKFNPPPDFPKRPL